MTHLKCIGKFSLGTKSFKLPTQYSRVRNKHNPTLIKFFTFFQGLRPYSGLHRAYLSSIRYKWGYAYSFCQIFHGLRLFKGVRLLQTLEQQPSFTSARLQQRSGGFSKFESEKKPHVIWQKIWCGSDREMTSIIDCEKELTMG